MYTVISKEARPQNRAIVGLVCHQTIVYEEMDNNKDIRLGAELDFNNSGCSVLNHAVDKIRKVDAHPEYAIRPIEVFCGDVHVGNAYFNYERTRPNLAYIDMFGSYKRLYRSRMEFHYNKVLDIVEMR